jgi:hypothetical protein
LDSYTNTDTYGDTYTNAYSYGDARARHPLGLGQ